MESEHGCSFETSTICSSNSENFQNMESLCKQLSDDENRDKDKMNPSLTLDLRGVVPNCDRTSENDDDEKLSAVLEQPEESSIIDSAQLLQDDQEDRELKYLKIIYNFCCFR